jgi:hypothetical protein
MPFDGQTRTRFMSPEDMLLDMVEFSFEGGKNWLREGFEKNDRRCLIGALIIVREQTHFGRDRVADYLVQAITTWNKKNRRSRHKETPNSIIIAFNDNEKRCFADIVEVIREARKLAREDAYVAQTEAGPRRLCFGDAGCRMP